MYYFRGPPRTNLIALPVIIVFFAAAGILIGSLRRGRVLPSILAGVVIVAVLVFVVRAHRPPRD